MKRKAYKKTLYVAGSLYYSFFYHKVWKKNYAMQIYNILHQFLHVLYVYIRVDVSICYRQS